MTKRLLALDDVETAYIGSDFSISHISLAMDKGEVLTLYGREGSGKTLLLRCVAGLEEIKSGKILLDGNELGEIDFKDRDIGFTFDFSSLNKNQTVGQILEYPMRLRNYDDERIEDCINNVVNAFSLNKEENVNGMSDFDKVKLLLARLFCIPRRLYLVDDVWKDLQQEKQEEIADILQDVVLNKSVVIATQDVNFARKLGKRNIAVVANGECTSNRSLENAALRPENIESAIVCGYSIYMDVLGKNEQGYYANIDGKFYSVDKPLSDIYVGKKVCFAFEEGIGAKGFYYDKDCEQIISQENK
ncbi:MAG: ATP-binding cassette domain-containing protein [Clostridia bacterium]|nr:ATP-binding cassette domain-containing protein [Clostridia bacterium]